MRRVIAILTAVTADGTLVLLTEDMHPGQLKEWRAHNSFHCPQCEHPMQLKVGDVVIPHFAHLPGSECQQGFSEGESPAHLLGKQQLYQLFHRQIGFVEMEPYLPAIAQRPDLLVTWNGSQVPIEFQCSRIPVALIDERNKGYRQAGMTPIWILQVPPSFRSFPVSVQPIQLSHYFRAFLRPLEHGHQSLLMYDSTDRQFHYFSHFLHLHGSKWIAVHRVLSLDEQTVPFARPLPPNVQEVKQYVYLYQMSRSQFIKTTLFYNRKGINHPFLRACYDMRIQPIHLPAWIGVPVLCQEAFREPDCEWQTLLIHAIREQTRMPSKMSYAFFHSFVNRFEGDAQAQIAACKAYCKFLTQHSIDIYRLDLRIGRNFVNEEIARRFLAIPTEN